MIVNTVDENSIQAMNGHDTESGYKFAYINGFGTLVPVDILVRQQFTVGSGGTNHAIELTDGTNTVTNIATTSYVFWQTFYVPRGQNLSFQLSSAELSAPDPPIFNFGVGGSYSGYCGTYTQLITATTSIYVSFTTTLNSPIWCAIF